MNEPIEATADATLWRTRATAYELLALSFAYPAEVLAEAVATGEWVEAAEEVIEALGTSSVDGFSEILAPCMGKSPEEVLHLLRVEATRLFVGSPAPVVSPYEGVHRAAEDGVQALLFVNPYSMEVERFMRSCGLGQPAGTNEPLDHVATELEFLQYLCMLETGIVESVPGIEIPEGGWSVVYESFLEEHARTWMPGFAERVVEESREPLYVAAAELLGAVAAA